MGPSRTGDLSRACDALPGDPSQNGPVDNVRAGRNRFVGSDDLERNEPSGPVVSVGWGRQVRCLEWAVASAAAVTSSRGSSCAGPISVNEDMAGRCFGRGRSSSG